jgi:hypothetical protein
MGFSAASVKPAANINTAPPNQLAMGLEFMICPVFVWS